MTPGRGSPCSDGLPTRPPEVFGQERSHAAGGDPVEPPRRAWVRNRQYGWSWRGQPQVVHASRGAVGVTATVDGRSEPLFTEAGVRARASYPPCDGSADRPRDGGWDRVDSGGPAARAVHTAVGVLKRAFTVTAAPNSAPPDRRTDHGLGVGGHRPRRQPWWRRRSRATGSPRPGAARRCGVHRSSGWRRCRSRHG